MCVSCLIWYWCPQLHASNTGKALQINNAGANYNCGSENSVEHAEQVIQTNYYGTKNVTQAMVPIMRHSDAGARIVNVSSKLGKLHSRRNVCDFTCFQLPSFYLALVILLHTRE